MRTKSDRNEMEGMGIFGLNSKLCRWPQTACSEFSSCAIHLKLQTFLTSFSCLECVSIRGGRHAPSNQVQVSAALRGQTTPAFGSAMGLYKFHLLQLVQDVSDQASRSSGHVYRSHSPTVLPAIHLAKGLHSDPLLHVDVTHDGRCTDEVPIWIQGRKFFVPARLDQIHPFRQLDLCTRRTTRASRTCTRSACILSIPSFVWDPLAALAVPLAPSTLLGPNNPKVAIASASPSADPPPFLPTIRDVDQDRPLLPSAASFRLPRLPGVAASSFPPPPPVPPRLVPTIGGSSRLVAPRHAPCRWP
mmetsp:Transcript_9212/g.55957  ORF Transcript_9212/g.55957 Transcript_9212/m.55957 type:complete len:303 (-) Transcript_9212:139-1047(-)